MKKIKKFFKNPYLFFVYLAYKGCFTKMRDDKYIKYMFRARMGKWPNLKNPTTFNEKLQWLKLYDRKPEYTTMVDKYEVKKYVAEKIGEEHIIPTLCVWDKFEDIDFDSLPKQFVLKSTHDSGGVCVCEDKFNFDIAAAKQKINKSLDRNYYYSCREWPYKNVKPRIIAEEYLSALGEEGLVEYKIFCFNGVAKIVLVCKGTAHAVGRTNDFMDRDFNRIPVKSLNPISETEPERPEQLDDIIEIAEKLSAGIPQLRVDTYIANGKIYVGELTLFHNGGMSRFEPEEWDHTFGSWIDLSSIKQNQGTNKRISRNGEI